MTLVLTEVRDAVGIIGLDHPQRRNALSHRMVEEIVAALADFGRRRLRAVILRAAKGSAVWSAGHDVHE
jgi:methylmalonyl-CoA decarboxylase